jgi:hypothetical protein
VYLNSAFDGLNRCESKLQSVSTELGDIIAESIRLGVVMYRQSRQYHLDGEYKISKRYAKSICELCLLLNNLADESGENILKLPMPPKMNLINSQRVKAAANLHPSLIVLDSFIRNHMMHASKFYKKQLHGYAETLSNFSKRLRRIEKIH